MKLLLALTGVILLISGAVLGSAAVQQPFFDFLQVSGPESGPPRSLTPGDCEAPAGPGVNWSGCDKSGSTLLGPDDSLANAIMEGTILSASHLNSVDMTNSAIQDLDLEMSTLFLVNFKGAGGVPGGSAANFFIVTCPDGSAVANYSGDVSAACDWLPAGSGSPMPETGSPNEKPGSTPDPESASYCWEGISNGGFEDKTAWDLPEDAYQSMFSQEQVHAGEWSMRTGFSDGEATAAGLSSVRQKVMIPANIPAAILSFYLFPHSFEPAQAHVPDSEMEGLRSSDSDMGDAQWVILHDEDGKELERLLDIRSDSQTWERFEFNLVGYAGETIVLTFGTYNNGSDALTALYVDDVSLTSCPAAAPVDTQLPAPGISGRATDVQGLPIEGLPLTLDNGAQTTTDSGGNYHFAGLADGAYIIAPLQNQSSFEPQTIEVQIPPPAVEQDFVGMGSGYP